MKHSVLALMLAFLAAAPLAAAEEKAAPAKAAAKAEAAKAAAESPDDGIQGLYEGTAGDAKAKAEVVAEAVGSYRVILTAGKGADARRFEWTGKAEGGKVSLFGKPGETGAIADKKLTAEAGSLKFSLTYVTPKSPTSGTKPPADAIALIPFEEGKPPSMEEWTSAAWQPQADGSVLVAKEDIRTKRQFGDFQMHAEFRIPFEPTGKGQGRGNSGIYILDLYEVQVLDSFGAAQPKEGDCGGIYTRTPPKENACYPPAVWQTYDITFRAPRFDADGKKVKDAVITVVQNGVKIHDQQTIAGPTGGARGKPEVKAGPIRLQYHQHPVRFRNMWIVPLKD